MKSSFATVLVLFKLCLFCFCVVIILFSILKKKKKKKTFLHVQLLSSHYKHFSRYYQSIGVIDKTSLGVPSEEEKKYSALLVYRLLDSLKEVSYEERVVLTMTEGRIQIGR